MVNVVVNASETSRPGKSGWRRFADSGNLGAGGEFVKPQQKDDRVCHFLLISTWRYNWPGDPWVIGGLFLRANTRKTGTMDADKSGWKTTEFWLNLVAVVVAYLIASGVAGGDDTLFTRILLTIATVLAALGYTASRTLVKRASIHKGK